MSSLALDLGREWLLIDCGEGTQHQVLRSPLSLHRLAGVLITHLHGDHVLGLPGLLATMGLEGRERALPIVGPFGLGRWLDVTASLPMLGIGFALEITELADHDLTGGSRTLRRLPPMAGLGVETAGLAHRAPSHGFRFTEPDRPGRVDPDAAARLGVESGPDLGRLQRGETVTGTAGPVRPHQVVGPPRRGRVVTVFGDTMPCPSGVALAANADLVVHEATYCDEHADMASRWTHSTASGAAGVVRDSGARRLLLTHFSSRYPDVESHLRQARAVHHDVAAAAELRWVDLPPPD